MDGFNRFLAFCILVILLVFLVVSFLENQAPEIGSVRVVESSDPFFGVKVRRTVLDVKDGWVLFRSENMKTGYMTEGSIEVKLWNYIGKKETLPEKLPDS